jgi:hypothetical protein
MGLKHAVLHRIPIRPGHQPEHLRGVVAQMQHQAETAIAPGNWSVGMGMIYTYASGFEQVAHPQQGVGIEIGMVKALPDPNPGFLTTRHADLQAAIPTRNHLRPESFTESPHLGCPEPMAERVGKDRLQRALVLAVHGSR